MTNKNSSDVDPTMSGSELAYIVLTSITAVLSVIGGTAICVMYFTFKDIRRSPGRKLLLYLAFSDALLALGNLLGVMWYLYRDSSVINRSKIYCDFQSAMTIYFSIASFNWTVIMALCIFATVVLGKARFTVSNMKLFHASSWLPPGIIVITAVSLDVLGTDTTLKAASWCWINPTKPNTLLWQFVTGKFFEIVAYLTTVALYLLVKIYLKRQVRENIRMSTRRRSRKEIMNEANRKLTFVPLVFIVCRIWGTLRFLLGSFAHDIVDEPYVSWINPLQGIGDSAQGFANFVLYCFCTDSIKRRIVRKLSRVCNQKTDESADNCHNTDDYSNTSGGTTLTTVQGENRQRTSSKEQADRETENGPSNESSIYM